ncbi:MAG: hypothetical protein RL648_91, partial [Verrucomicrobiota bacterium]
MTVRVGVAKRGTAVIKTDMRSESGREKALALWSLLVLGSGAMAADRLTDAGYVTRSEVMA